MQKRYSPDSQHRKKIFTIIGNCNRVILIILQGSLNPRKNSLASPPPTEDQDLSEQDYPADQEPKIIIISEYRVSLFRRQIPDLCLYVHR